MIYDKYGASGNCRGCGCVTNYAIEGYLFICLDCIGRLRVDIEKIQEIEYKEQQTKEQE